MNTSKINKSLILTIILLLSISCTMYFISIETYAASFDTPTQYTKIEKINSDLYCITTIEVNDYKITQNRLVSASSTKTKTASKTVEYQNGEGTTLWYVKVTGTFIYNGSTSSCSKSSVSAASYNSSWTISNKSSYKSGNTAYASATGIKKFMSVTIQTITRNVSLSCSKNGTLS